jgi:HK97 family phage portal protein
MSLFYNIGQWLFGGLYRERGLQYPQPAYAEASASPVTFDTALQLSAVWACLKLLSETPASLPLKFYNMDGLQETENKDHALYKLFAGKVNRYQNSNEFWETVLLNLHTHGNAYCLIQKAGDRVIGLLPLMSSQVETSLMTDGSITYQYTADSGVKIYAEASIWHLKLMGNGIIGLSPLAYQRNTLGIAQSAEQAVTKIYANGAKPSGVLTFDRLLTKAQREEARANFATLTTGSGERLMVLEKGTAFQPISLSPQDIELLESRKFQISEICRWYGVPSVMVNDNNGTSVWGSGIEQIMSGFYRQTLRPTLEKIERSMMVKFLTEEERETMKIEFDVDALLRGDKKTMYEAYKSAVNGSLMTPNEGRNHIGLPPIAGGDKLLVQGAMVPIESVGLSEGIQNGTPEETAVP